MKDDEFIERARAAVARSEQKREGLQELSERVAFLEERIMEIWHQGHTGTMPLHEALGMRPQDYEAWVRGRQERTDQALRETREAAKRVMKRQDSTFRKLAADEVQELPKTPGIYWFRGTYFHELAGREVDESTVVKVDLTNHANEPDFVGKVMFLGWDIGSDLRTFKGEWREITEDLAFRLPALCAAMYQIVGTVAGEQYEGTPEWPGRFEKAMDLLSLAARGEPIEVDPIETLLPFPEKGHRDG